MKKIIALFFLGWSLLCLSSVLRNEKNKEPLAQYFVEENVTTGYIVQENSYFSGVDMGEENTSFKIKDIYEFARGYAVAINECVTHKENFSSPKHNSYYYGKEMFWTSNKEWYQGVSVDEFIHGFIVGYYHPETKVICEKIIQR